MTTAWSEYAKDNSYSDSEYQRKKEFVSEYCEATRPNVVWDLGCNTGEFSSAALKSGASLSIGFEMDHGALELAWQRSIAEDINFLPLCVDAANPSPSQGWNQIERLGIGERKNADAVLALALVHHLRIGRNIPLDYLLDWLVNLTHSGIIEFVPKSDSMCQELLALREDIFDDYTVDIFESMLGARCRIVRKEVITKAGRTLYWFEK